MESRRDTSTRVLGAGVGLEALQLDFRNHEAYAGSSSLTRTVVHHLNPFEQCRDKSYSCCTVTARAPSAPASRASPRSPSARASPTRLRSMYPSHRSNQSRRSPNRRYFSGQRARIVASHQYRARFTSRWHLRSQDGCGEPHLRARRAASAGGIGGQATIRSPRRQSSPIPAQVRRFLLFELREPTASIRDSLDRIALRCPSFSTLRAMPARRCCLPS